MDRPEIESYEFGRLVIAGHVYTKDLILLPDRIVEGWWRQEGHVLHTADLDLVFEAGPDVLIVGQGAYGRMKVTEETRRALERAGIEVIALSSGKAVERYNAISKDRSLAAAFHLTC